VTSTRTLTLPAALWLCCSACSNGGGKAPSTAAASNAGSGGSGGASSSSGGSGGDAGGDAGAGGSAGDGGAGYAELGVCGRRGEATVDKSGSYRGFDELYLVGERGLGQELCVVRYPVESVGPAPAGCQDFAGQQDACEWAYRLEYGNPSVLTDDAGVCKNSDLALDAAALAAIPGTRVAYGFVDEYAGHNSVLLEYDEPRQRWLASGNASWDSETSDFIYDRRDGFCGY
jgi:hypothetical protein